MSKSEILNTIENIHPKPVGDKSRELIEYLCNSAMPKEDILTAVKLIDELIYTAIEKGVEMACKLNE